MSAEMQLALVNLLIGGIALARVYIERRKRERDHDNIRASHDLARRLAFKLEQLDPTDPQVRHIRAKATRISNEMWEQSGHASVRKVPKVFAEDGAAE